MGNNRLDSQIHRAALPVHQQESGILRLTHGRFEIGSVAHRFVVHFLNYVAALQAGIGSFAGRVHVAHHNSGSGGRQSELPGSPGGDVLYRDPLQGIFAGVLRLFVPGSFRGHFRQGQWEGFLRAVTEHFHVYLGSRSHQRNVHAQFGAAVYRRAVDVQDDVTLFQASLLGRAVGGHVADQRAARVAGVDRRIGLNEVLVVFDSEIGAALSADDAHGDGLADAEGIADGQHVVAHLHLIGIANGDGLQGSGVHLEYGDVGLRIGAHHAGFVFVLILHDHGHGGGMVHHVVVGQDVAIRTDDHARAQALFLLLPRHAELSAAVTLITAKELAEHRRDSVIPSLKARLHDAGRSNGYDRRQYLLHHWGETVAARWLVRTRELKRGWRVQQVIRTRHREATQSEGQKHRRGCSLRSTPIPLHLHVASKKSRRITTELPYVEWLHLYRWGQEVSGLSREVGICGTGDLVCADRGAAS